MFAREMGRLQQLDAALDAGCSSQTGVGGQKRGCRGHFCKGDVGGVVAAQVVSKGPHPRPKPIGGKSCDRETDKAFHREVALLAGEHLTANKAAQHMCDLTINQMRCRELFFAQKVWIEAAGKQFHDDTGVHDPHSPRPSWSTDKIALRSARPWAFF